jgi:hypothetical protein
VFGVQFADFFLLRQVLRVARMTACGQVHYLWASWAHGSSDEGFSFLVILILILILQTSPIRVVDGYATPHFVAFFVLRVVVYASSQDFVETALGQSNLNTKGAFNPRYT